MWGLFLLYFNRFMSFFLACAADSENPGLYSVVHLPLKSAAYDLLSKMLEYVVPFEFMGISCMLYAYNNYNEAIFRSSSCILYAYNDYNEATFQSNIY